MLRWTRPASLVTYEFQLKLILARHKLDLSLYPKLDDFALNAYRSGLLAEDAALIIKAAFAAIDRIHDTPPKQAAARTAALDEMIASWDQVAKTWSIH